MGQSPNGRIRILLIDDHALFREGLAGLLSGEADFEIVARCASVEQALQVLAAGRIDIVLLDFDLGAERGSDLLIRAREGGFRGRVLVVTAGLSDPDAVQLVSLGATGIFLKHSPPALLSNTIRTVMKGEVWLDQRYLAALLRARTPTGENGGKQRLTSRERDVLRNILEGLANKEIADRLQVSEAAVKAALQQLFRKNAVRTRSQLVRIALERFREEL